MAKAKSNHFILSLIAFERIDLESYGLHNSLANLKHLTLSPISLGLVRYTLPVIFVIKKVS